MVKSRFKCESVLYFQSCKLLYGAAPNEKLKLMYILKRVSLWAAEKYDEVVEISKEL